MATKDVNMSKSKLKVLELYSGIGGMHWALKGELYTIIF